MINVPYDDNILPLLGCPVETEAAQDGMKISGKPIKVEIFEGGEEQPYSPRIAMAVYRAGDRYFFFDIGWIGASWHPIHEIGKLTKADDGNGVWHFEEIMSDGPNRTFRLSVLEEDAEGEDGHMVDDYFAYKKFLEQRKITDDFMAEQIRSTFFIPATIKIVRVG